MDRLRPDLAGGTIRLTDSEQRALSPGYGWRLARFENGILAAVFDPLGGAPKGYPSAQAPAGAVPDTALAWLEGQHALYPSGECVLAMFIYGQACNPLFLPRGDDDARARMTRILTDAARSR